MSSQLCEEPMINRLFSHEGEALVTDVRCAGAARAAAVFDQLMQWEREALLAALIPVCRLLEEDTNG